jgi:hypothetical protein
MRESVDGSLSRAGETAALRREGNYDFEYTLPENP